MILITKSYTILSGAEADLYISPEDLDLLISNESVRQEFLRGINKEYIEVEPLVKPIKPQFKSFSYPVGGCSHSIFAG